MKPTIIRWYPVNFNYVYYLSSKIHAGQGEGMSNTGRIAIDDNAVIHEFYRQEYIELGLTGY